MQSKDQLKQLRVQKAAAAQQVALAESQRKAKPAAVAAAAAQLRPKAAAGMPPPAPRAPSGSVPAATSSKAAVSSSSARPQAALIRPKPPQAGQRSVNGAIQEPARPSGMLNDLMPCHVMHALVLLCLLDPLCHTVKAQHACLAYGLAHGASLHADHQPTLQSVGVSSTCGSVVCEDFFQVRHCSKQLLCG